MKESLLKSANQLKQPKKAYVQEFSAKWEQLSAKGSQILALRSDVEKLVGKGNQQMAEDNNRNFPRFMESLFSNYAPEVFIETVLWVFRAYQAHGFHTTYWAANLNIWVDMLKEDLSAEAFEAIHPFYDWIIVNIPVFVKLADIEISEIHG